MSNLLLNKDPAKKRWAIAPALMIVYLWWLVTTPEYSNRLAFLATIRFERILAVAILLAIVLGGRIKPRSTGMTPLVIIFFICTIISFLLSPYADFPRAQHWAEQYWKLIVFYFFVLYCFEDAEDLRRVFLAYAVICFTYQLYSWIGFLGGGSYRWEQGVKRIIGTWSPYGPGAANAFALLAVYSAPFAVFLLKTDLRPLVRWMAWGLLAMSVATIVFSGTRGAVLTLLVIVIIYFRQRLFHPKYLIIAAVIMSIFVSVLPSEMKHRYFDLIFYDESSIENRSDRLAISSAQGRTEGMVDGWKLFLRRPLVGYGPETSSIARLEVRDLGSDDGERRYLQLHNLYAQLISENGLLGTLVFAAIIILYMRQLVSLRKRMDIGEQSGMIKAQVQLLLYLMLTVLVYGAVSHTLYKYYWFFLFACQAILVSSSGRLSCSIKRNGRADDRTGG